MIEVEDIQSSAVVPRVMNSLRHTRSEENLLSTNNFSHPAVTNGDDSADNWTQEDDEISQQVGLKLRVV